MKKPVIAIDGYSSTGKSSISKVLAKELGFIHIDTGALYRGITLFALRNIADEGRISNPQKLKDYLHKIHLEFRTIDGSLQLYLNNENIDQQIRDPQIAKYVSIIAKEQFVRDFLLSTQQKLAENGGVIMDGRDIGTVVLPNADYKFFLTASIDERTRRRYDELICCGTETDMDSVRVNLQLRDKIDSEREVAPLKQAEDAILIDNTSLNKEETIALIRSFIK